VVEIDGDNPIHYKNYQLTNLYEAYDSLMPVVPLTKEMKLHELPDDHRKISFSEFQKYVDKHILKNLEASFIHLSCKKTDVDYGQICVTYESLMDKFAFLFGYQSPGFAKRFFNIFSFGNIHKRISFETFV